MIDITNKDYQPGIAEIGAYIDNPLFYELCAHLESTHKALIRIDYSGDNVLPGWNIRFHKSGRTLIRLYPRHGYFTVLVVVGRRERARAEALLPQTSDAMQAIYQSAEEGMGQRWLLIDLHEPNALYRDVLQLAAIRRESN